MANSQYSIRYLSNGWAVGKIGKKISLFGDPPTNEMYWSKLAEGFTTREEVENWLEEYKKNYIQ